MQNLAFTNDGTAIISCTPACAPIVYVFIHISALQQAVRMHRHDVPDELDV